MHALWVAPERDPELAKARKKDRVMTLPPGGHGKADFGLVGFDASKPGAQFLIFPKSLRPFDGARVVGIKFDLVEQPALRAADDRAVWAAPLPHRAKKGPPAKKARGHGSPENPAAAKAVAPDAAPRSAAPLHNPADERHHTADTTPSTQRQTRSRGSEPGGGEHKLLTAVHAALRELKAGKAVAAYQRLERAAAEAEQA